MKSLKHIAPCIMLTLALSTVVFARNKNEGSLTLVETVSIGSTQLQPGQYKAEWKAESGNAVKIDILQHGKTVASVKGTLKEVPQPFPQDAISTKPLGDNARAIEEIDFANRKEALLIGE